MSSSSKEYFDAIGAGWDRFRESLFSERVRDEALAAAEVQRGGIAADLGAGTGFMTQGLLAREVRVVAVDQSENMLELLRRKFPWPDRVECRIGGAENLPIADRSVDYCLANMYLHHVERPSRAISEMARILKPGGRTVVTDLNTHEFEFLMNEHHDRWPGFERRDVAGWYRLAGLSDIRVVALDEKCRATSTGDEDATVGIFLAVGTKPVSG